MENVGQLLKPNPDVSLVEDVRTKLAHRLLIVRKRGLELLHDFLEAYPTSSTSASDDQQKSLTDIQSFVVTSCLNPATDAPWHVLQGSLLAAVELLEFYLRTDDNSPLRKDYVVLRETMFTMVERHLEDEENRIRLAIADVLHRLTQLEGVSVYVRVRDRILESIERNFVRDEASSHKVGPLKRDPDAPRHSLVTDSPSLKPQTPSQPPAQRTNGVAVPTSLHDTEGWKSLETSFKALQVMVEAAGDAFIPHVTESILGLLYRSLVHQNRFVREMGYFTLGSMSHVCDADKFAQIMDKLTAAFARGLADNWSQVRYSACVATRMFLKNPHCQLDKALQNILVKASASPGDVACEALPIEPYLSRLIPPLCLNRYYVAQGVRLYSLETWKVCFSEAGRDIVGVYMESVCEFYISQCNADNHAVRESACHCTAELATKVDDKWVRPYVARLLQGLLVCFKDESWPVRDAASTASGVFVSVYTEESRSVLPELYDLWYAHVGDNIPSVREGSAVALGSVINAYGEEALELAVKNVRENLMKAKSQKSESKQYGDLENTTTFGVAHKKARDNDDELHSGQQQYSCGSLAPKLRRGGGCMDHGFKREMEPWECSDGYVYLVRELSKYNPTAFAEAQKQSLEARRGGSALSSASSPSASSPSASSSSSSSSSSSPSEPPPTGPIPTPVTTSLDASGRLQFPPLGSNRKRGIGGGASQRPGAALNTNERMVSLMTEYLPQLYELARLSHFAHHNQLKVSVCKAIPVIAQQMGKTAFKRTGLELLFEAIIPILEVGNRLAQSAASDVIAFLDGFLGHGIFMARLDDVQKRKIAACQFCRIQIP